ncbi:MAG: His/Gly/Thr/Pro-type tRNA ligase C-terminal domain-containing protein, partial [Candidatus Marinimicrobia bacterium]|nr:His/Gly/Thr/Pro-type tRNA ligase C-terminal domain-containing protein [Candidatus Neomarinimicrobiota bacterium]
KASVQLSPPDLYIAPIDNQAYKGIVKYCTHLRNQGFIIETDLLRRSVKAMMREANRKQARFVTVIGSEELNSGTLTLKHLETGQEYPVNWDNLGEFLEKTILPF